MSGGGSKPGERRGGRKKGIPNKKTAEVAEKIRSYGVEPLEGMARIARWAEEKMMEAEGMKERLDCMNLAGKMYAELAEYEAPKRSRIEHGATEGGKVTLVIEG